ncbi:MAG TPA: hypothetical protein VH594_06770 [Trebonia sp.]
MTANRFPWMAFLGRVLRSWYTPAVLGLLLLIAFAVWVRPIRNIRYVAADEVAARPVLEDSPRSVDGLLVADWDTSRWQAVAVWWPAVLGLTVFLVALLLVLRYSHGWLLEKASAARYFFASLVLHALLLLALSGVGVGYGIVEDAHRISQGEAPLALSGLSLSPIVGRPAYAEVADPGAPAGSSADADMPRQAATPAEAIDRAPPARGSDPAVVRPVAPPDRAFVPVPRPDAVSVALDRRRADARPVEEKSDLPTLPPVESPRVESPTARPAEVIRQDATSPTPAAVAGAPRTLPQARPEAPLSPAAVQPERPTVTEVAVLPLPAGRRPAPAAEVARTTRKTDTVPTVASPTPQGQEPPGTRVALDRRESPVPVGDRPATAGRTPELPRATMPGGPGNVGPPQLRVEGDLPESKPSGIPLGRTTARAAPAVAASTSGGTAGASLPPSAASGEKPVPGAEAALPRATAPGGSAASPPARVGEAPALPRSLPASGSPGATPPGRPLDDAPRVAAGDLPLPRRTAGTAPVAPVVDRFALREDRPASVEKFGGTKESEEAVERGLDWLAAHQGRDGGWSVDGFPTCCNHPKCTGAATVHADAAATGLALLSFLGAGYTHRSGKHNEVVGRGLTWLVQHQQPDGRLSLQDEVRPTYGQGIAALALCEAYGMTSDAKLKGAAQKALDWILKSRHAGSGGWRYTPNQAADTSVTGWQVMALRSGEMARLKVNPVAFDGVKRWLASVEGNKPTGGVFGYQTTSPTPAMTAQGLLALQLMGVRRDDPRMKAGADYLLQYMPRTDGVSPYQTSYYWYHATQVMYHMQGDHWKKWNEKCRDLLVSSQEKKGGASGSWPPVDAREKTGGRLYATSLRLLMLEVYYRHLPIYQQLGK